MILDDVPTNFRVRGSGRDSVGSGGSAGGSGALGSLGALVALQLWGSGALGQTTPGASYQHRQDPSV